MVLLAALVLAATPAAPPQRAAAERQAIATVRILAGAPVRFGQLEKIAPARLSDARIRDTDGSSRAARLVEFH